MNHEELQLKIYQIDKYNEATDEQGTENWQEVDKALQALRAVVELHKPVQGSSDVEIYDYVGCDACKEWSHDGNMNVAYPCPTIQAIEKELQ